MVKTVSGFMVIQSMYMVKKSSILKSSQLISISVDLSDSKEYNKQHKSKGSFNDLVTFIFCLAIHVFRKQILHWLRRWNNNVFMNLHFHQWYWCIPLLTRQWFITLLIFLNPLNSEILTGRTLPSIFVRELKLIVLARGIIVGLDKKYFRLSRINPSPRIGVDLTAICLGLGLSMKH